MDDSSTKLTGYYRRKQPVTPGVRVEVVSVLSERQSWESKTRMISFVCNICGRYNEVEHFETESESCFCGSNVRARALIHLLSLEILDRSVVLVDFPKLKSVRGIGMSDQECYAAILTEKFDYTNTFYDREPRLDFTVCHPEFHGTYDFVLSSDVLEHIEPPVERALGEAFKLLRPNGFLGITVWCNPSDSLREHFPDLHIYRTVPLGDSVVLINRRADGGLEIRDDLIFHGGTGAILEMREFGITSLKQKLMGVGFQDIHLLMANIPEYGILFDEQVSQPLIARKDRFVMSRSAVHEVVGDLHAVRTERNRALAECSKLRAQMKMAGESRWLKLGRRLGVGPDFSSNYEP
jgi:SAM-dependent methyltransferase